MNVDQINKTEINDVQVKSNVEEIDQLDQLQSSRDHAEFFMDDFNINGFESQINMDQEEEEK